MKKILLPALVIIYTFTHAQVSFTVDTTTGCAPLTVNFTNTSSGATSYQWYFGDGNSTTLANPTHIYNYNGYYYVILIGFDVNMNQVGSAATYIEVLGGSADFNFSSNSVCPSEVVNFSSWTDAVSFSWDFGDGSSASGEYVNHVFSAEGTFSVTLETVSSCDGSITSIAKNVVVSNSAFPDADFYSSGNSVCPNDPIQFYPISSGMHSWNFGDGSASSLNYLVHSYSNTGTYIVTHEVTNICGNTASDTLSVFVIPDKPMEGFLNVSVYPPYNCPGEPVNLSVYGSNYSSFEWNFGDGTPLQLLTNSFTSHIFNTVGFYSGSVKVSNGCGNDTMVNFSVEISDDVPFTGWINMNITPKTACPNSNLNFSASANAESFLWNFGDGTYSSSSYANHVYSQEGVFVVTLTLVSNCGADTMLTDTVFISNSTFPVAEFFIDDIIICPGDKIFLYSAEPGNHSWDFGDGFTSLSSYPNHSYSDTGTFIIVHSITNSCGNSSNESLEISVVSDKAIESYFNVNVYPFVDCPGSPFDIFIFGGNYSSYEWNFGDGSPSQTTFSGFISHVYYAAGYYTGFVKITNGCGSSAINYFNVQVSNDIPISGGFYSYISLQEACPNTPVYFESGGYGGNYNYNFHWDFGDGSTSSSQYGNHIFTQVGNYVVTLTVSNNCGSDTTFLDTININNAAIPDPFDYYIAPFPGEVCPDDPVSIFFSPGGQGNYQWNFGDGTSTTSTTFDTLYSIDLVNHSYEAEGNYTGWVTFTNFCGNSFTDSFSVIVNNNVSVEGDLGWTGTMCPGSMIEFLAMGGATYLWNFGDGTAPVTVNSAGLLTHVFHSFDQAGSYTVSVTVANSCGNSETLESAIIINPCVLGIKTINATTENGISIYPNPGSGLFTLHYSSDENFSVTVYTMLGEIVYQSYNSELITFYTIDLSRQGSGLYYVRVRGEESTVVKKVVVEK